MFDPKTILVLAPHTDDGELGCGGSLARFAEEGKKIYYAAFSLCSKSLPQGLPADTLAHECKNATAVLGIPASNITLLDFEVREFPKLRQEILEESYIRKHCVRSRTVHNLAMNFPGIIASSTPLFLYPCLQTTWQKKRAH
jgi:LmbE family N-acetylglucosaminyl deacetylase